MAPSLSDHKEQAQRNSSFWQDHLASVPHGAAIEWSVVGMFYEAIHLVEAFLATKHTHSGSHADRRKNIGTYFELLPIRGDFDVLKTECDNARYGCYRHTEAEIKADLLPLIENVRTTVAGHVP